MTKNNVINHVNKQIQKLHFKMHKKKKNWIILGVSTVALIGGIGATSLTGVADGYIPSLPHKITHNNFSITNYTGKHGVKKSYLYKPKGYSADNDFHERFYGNNDNGDGQGRPEGAPYHNKRFLFQGNFVREPHYDYSDISLFHGALEKGDLQDGSGSTKIMRASINPNHVPSSVIARYPTSAKVAIPYKDKYGGTKYHKKWVDTFVSVTGIKLYKPWAYGGTSGSVNNHDASIVFSHNLHHGLWYNGIKQMHINYTFVEHGTNKELHLDNSYLEFNSINPLSSLTPPVRHHGQDASVNNQDYVKGVNNPYKYGKSKYNPTGESIIANNGRDEWSAWPHPGEKGATSSKHTIIWKYDTHGLFSGPSYAIGGRYNHTRNRHNASVVVGLHGSGANIDVGSGVGYGYFNPQTHIIAKAKPGHKKEHKKDNHKKHNNVQPSPNADGSLHKYISGVETNSDGSKAHITHRNQAFDYNLTGKLPTRTWKNSYHVHSYKTKKVTGTTPYSYVKNGVTYSGYVTHYLITTHYYRVYYDGHLNDHYNVTDNLPKEVRVNGDDSSVSDTLGVPVHVSWNGDHQVIHMNLDNNQMDSYSNDNFHIRIPVIANNLPQDSSLTNNSADSNTNETKDYDSSNYYAGSTSTHTGSNRPVDNSDSINSKGWYKFWNGADDNGGTNADDQIYKSIAENGGGAGNDSDKVDKSNDVSVKIRKIRYYVSHYDYGSDNGDFIPTDEVTNGGYNDQYHAHNSNTLAKYKGYGFEGDHVPIKVLSKNNGNAQYKGYDNGTGQGNDNALYRFGYGKYDWVFPTLGYGNDNGAGTSDNANNPYGMTERFYKPYIAPHAKITHMGRFMVATDKKDNMLPYRLDLKSDAYLYQDKWLSDNFGGDTINVNITSNGTTVGHKVISLREFLNETHHGKKLFELSGKLDTRGLNVKPGDKVPLKVQVSFGDPTEAQLEGITTNTHAWISSEHNMTAKDFKGSHKDTAKFKEPERTIKYFSDGEDDNPRTMDEELVMRQTHDGATAKTGYGLRSNLSLDYFGHINAKRYGSNGTDTDFAFPDSWNSKDSNINYQDNPYKNNSIAKGNGTSTNGKTLSDMHKWDNDNREHGSVGDYSSYDEANKADRLAHTDVNWKGGYSALDGQGLDEFNGIDSGYDKYVDSQFGNTVSGLSANGMPRGDTPGHYSTNFHFYPRAVLRDSGVVQLQHDEDLTNANSDGFSDGFSASNKNGTSLHDLLNNDKVISNVNNDRMYTPFWLPLGYYNTSFNKAMPSRKNFDKFNGVVNDAPTSFDNWYDNSDDKRLGGNFFNFEDNMFDQMVGHEYLADGSKSENKDELSLQPVLGGTADNNNGQNVKGFSQSDNNWIHFKQNWENFFNN